VDHLENLCVEWHLTPEQKGGPGHSRVRRYTHRSTPMLDILMLVLGLAFFAAAIGYSYVCERL
jgi:hypothetical protein